jgi:putative solute:sodium symporter small subunit
MDQAIQEYWRRNLRLKILLLSIWAIVSLLLAIILVNQLNEVSFGGFPLGFWVAQQGSIFTFVILIWVYAHTMDRYDAELEEKVEASR